jgi:glycosyltransferase involved in cell wall biosynthesis
MDNNKTFSIIVTSYTTERLDDIRELLESIRAQTYPDIETIFVAERSRELYEEVKAIGSEMPGLKVLFHDGEPGISAARNTGVCEARSDIIAFTDDDAVLHPRWAEESVKAYASDSGIIGLTGPILPQWEHPSMAWFPREFYWIFACTYYDWAEPREVRNGYGTNISFRREAFESVGLFPTYLGSERGGENGQQKTTAEEMELSLRVRQKTGKRIVYHPGVSIRHKVHRFRLSGKYIRRRSFIEGRSKMLIKKLYQSNGRKEALLETEHELLKRILFRLYPGILKGLFTNPLIAWHQFYVTTTVLSSVAAGYLSYTFKNPACRENGRPETIQSN